MAAVNTVSAEYRAITEGVGLIDRSERGKLALTGTDAKEFLAGQVTNDIVGLQPGTGCYAALLTPKGKMLGDLRVLDAGDELLVDLERAALQDVFDVTRRATIGFRVELHKRTLQRGLLSLVGPRARELAGATDLRAEEHAHASATIAGREVRVIATDLGVDVLCLAEDTETVREAFLEAGAEHVSEEAVEILRVERGRPRWGAELDQTIIPQEAGLNDRAVSFTKGCYVGQETVARLHWRGKPNRHLRGLVLSAPVPAGTPLWLGDREVGKLGSVAESPAHGTIGLAVVRREASVGDVLRVGDGDVTATVGDVPFGLPPAA
jgi:folate-binding protein YgfZ